MKKIIFLLCIIISICCNGVKGQNLLPDNSFESWKNSTTLNKWNAVKLSGFTLNPPSRSTDKQDGVYSAKLKSLDITALAKLMGYNVDKMVLPGMLFSGTVDAAKMITILGSLNLDSLDFSNSNFQQQMTSILTSGVPIKTKPASISGYYKYTPADTTESCVIGIAVFYTDTLKSVTGTDSISRHFVGGSIYLDSANSSTAFKHFSVPVVYFNSQLTPNEMLVIISNSFNQKVGSELIVDNFSVEEETKTDGIFNNYADNQLFRVKPLGQQSFKIDIDTQNRTEVNVYDTKGLMIYSNNQYESGKTIKLPFQGVYILKVKQGRKASSGKLIIN